MASYDIRYDFGTTNEQDIIAAINDLNAGKDTTINIYHNGGGNARLAIDLSSAILSSSAQCIEICVIGYAGSAAAFVVMSCQLYAAPNVIMTIPEPCMIMYHRPRIDNNMTGLEYFDLPSSTCMEYDRLMHDWLKVYPTSYNNMKAYYSNHEYVFITR
ncbi:hypothetical protein [Phytobacter massiliensis]|uniref:hypothetical protein n=1 Tax=Phytobacter massiliensis TaxID=1485952 RepID=UPI0005C764AA|nr:hypothetical protein [Phytobacter massiliensis]